MRLRPLLCGLIPLLCCAAAPQAPVVETPWGINCGSTSAFSRVRAICVESGFQAELPNLLAKVRRIRRLDVSCDSYPQVRVAFSELLSFPGNTPTGFAQFTILDHPGATVVRGGWLSHREKAPVEAAFAHDLAFVLVGNAAPFDRESRYADGCGEPEGNQ